MQYLINNGAKVNVKDNEGNGLLERVENGEVSSRAAAQFLIDRDAKVNAVVDEYGTTELMRAVENRNMKTVQYLINSGVVLMLMQQINLVVLH